MNAALQPQSPRVRRLKIAQVATSDISVRLLLLEQIEALTRAGHEVVAVCSASEHIHEVRRRGIVVEALPMTREPGIGDAASLLALVHCFRRHRFDVVHTHTPKAGLLGPLAARLARVPVVVHTIHGLLVHDSQPKWRRALGWLPEKITASLSHRLLSQSEEDVHVACEMKLGSPGKIAYLGNGVDVERFHPPSAAERAAGRYALGLQPDEFAIGSVGRLVYEKGFAELFSAAAQIRGRDPSARFLVAGAEEPDQRDAVPRKLMSELTARGQIEFLGWWDRMASFYAALDLFVLPSHREGLPRACMEAAASSLPVVASNIRGCREVVRDGETGLLFPVKNSEALAEAITKLLSDRPRAQAMGSCGRRHIVAHFDERQVLGRLCSFYEELAEKIQAQERQ